MDRIERPARKARLVVKCYGPGGAQATQVVLWRDGTVEVFGDKSTAVDALAALMSGLVRQAVL